MEKVLGRISVNPRGFGFLNYDGDKTAFIVPPDLNPFLDGDMVSARVSAAENGRFNASDLVLEERTRGELFGSIVFRGRKPFLKVDRLVSNTDWPLSQNELELEEGLYLVAALDGARLVPLRIIETEADLGLERCGVRHGIRSVFPAEVLEQARRATLTVASTRRDLRELPTVTIDAPSTTDIDDALSALPPEADGALRVLVSIADVDAMVPEGSALDLEARRRATSVYMAGRVIPMLPEELSSATVSLLPDEERLTLTAELRIDPEGQITAVDVYESVIRSHARLSYEAVSSFLLGADPEAVPEGVAPTVRRLRTAAARLSLVRAARGGVELASEEAYVSFDPTTRQPTGLEPRGETMAHRIVERLMVAANEAIAGWLVDRGLPGMFRVHPEPDSEKVRMLADSARHFGIEAGFGPRLSPRGLAAFEGQYRGTSVALALRTVLGRTLGPAQYTPVSGQHFGLGAPLYLHFTSPIRRYADLLVHRVIKRYLAGDRSQIPQDPALMELASHLNAATWKASKAESERMRMLVARIFRERIGEVVEGNVVAIKPFGLVLQMSGTGATGTIASESLPDGPYRVERHGQQLVGARDTFAVGDYLEARVVNTNEDLGRVDLELV
ncbi:ribonuclease R [bacterium SCN 62-11]|nr:RNB domain-containing ribonuclease [Candidatus Eremiobacteraeota bacterium]ODT64621.1 MAG: ribonuclease R [bacterium SCN 62-11]